MPCHSLRHASSGAGGRSMQGCRKSDTFSPQVWRGDNGARWVQTHPARPLAGLQWDRPVAVDQGANRRPFAGQEERDGAPQASWPIRHLVGATWTDLCWPSVASGLAVMWVRSGHEQAARRRPVVSEERARRCAAGLAARAALVPRLAGGSTQGRSLRGRSARTA